MTLHVGQRVQELTKKVGQTPRHGKIVSIDGDSIEVDWDNGHRSIVSHALLIPEKESKEAAR